MVKYRFLIHKQGHNHILSIIHKKHHLVMLNGDQRQIVLKQKNVFITCNADGEISHYHLASKKCLSTIKDTGPPGDNNKDP